MQIDKLIMDENRLVPISAIQHYLFCKRQCALIHNEQLWSENYLTASGRQLHERVDSGEPETRKGVRYERGVVVNAPLIGITGKLDLLERHLKTGQLLPVEYKRGKPKKDDLDAVQLCAQVLSLEEMLNLELKTGALWYWQTRKRVVVEITSSLRAKTLKLITEIQQLFCQGITPQPVVGKHCQACSLQSICQPTIVNSDSTSQYISQLYSTEYE